MRIYNRDLRKARRWLGAGRSIRVIRFLEPKVPLFLEDPQYYAILGRACLDAGLLKDAETYLNRGLQADPSHLEIRLTLAVHHLRTKDPAGAVRTWLEIMEDIPQEKYSRRGLRALKKITDPHQQDRFLERFDARQFMPSVSPKWPRRLLIVLMALLVVLLVVYFRNDLLSALSVSAGANRREGSESLIPPGQQPLTDSGGDVLYPMDDAEVMATLRRAVDHFQAYQDNRARLELNKIRYSNATEDIRRQAMNLIGILAEPTIENLETGFTYAEVAERPWLYEGCWVLWTGVTANVVYAGDAIRFELLVGFQDGRVLEGRVPVEVPFAAVMEPLPLEILGQVVSSGNTFSLTGRTLHFLR